MLLELRMLSRRAQQMAVRSYTATGNVRSTEQHTQEWKSAKPFDEIPGMSALQWVRAHMKGGEFKGMPLNDVFLKCRQRYGDICRFPGVFGQPAMVSLFNVDHFAQVFRTEGPYPVRPGNDALIHYRQSRPDGFFRSVQGLIGNGEQWWQVRHAVNPILMQPRNAKLYLHSVQQVSEDFIQRILSIRHPDTLEMPETFEKEINCLTFESVAVVALDTRLGLVSDRGERTRSLALFENIYKVLVTSFELSMKPSMYKYFKTPTYRRFEQANERVFEVTGEYIDAAMRRIAAKPAKDDETKSVFEKLLQIDPKIAQVMAMDLLLGGVDTTTSAFCTTLMCLAKNPEKQQKLRDEVLSIVPRSEDKFTIENMKEMPYMRACLKEALRVYPLFFGVPREAGVDLVLDGYRVPKGSRLVMCANLLLNEEENFPRPGEFLPERWLRSSKAAHTLNPFVYLPFGFGPRFCIGKRIVDLMFEVNIANLVRNFRIEFDYPAENAFASYAMLKPAVPMKFKFTNLN